MPHPIDSPKHVASAVETDSARAIAAPPRGRGEKAVGMR